ncbi:MAG: hypothetical protein NVS1B1_11160 [Candidatus Limnocylindrales bacterium]
MTETPVDEPDPLRAFISRSLRTEVSDVSEVIIRDTTDGEIDRVSFTEDGRRRTLIITRVPHTDALEVRLLPHLARKSDHVPRVHARGIPPATARGWPWLLIEDLFDAPASDDLGAVVRAKAAVELAVAADGPALAALGVPRRPSTGPLAEWPAGLVHGAFGREAALCAERGVVLVGWRRAFIGCPLIDIATLAADAAVRPEPLFAAYAAAVGRQVTPALLTAALQASGSMAGPSRVGDRGGSAVEESPGSTGQGSG